MSQSKTVKHYVTRAVANADNHPMPAAVLGRDTTPLVESILSEVHNWAREELDYGELGREIQIQLQMGGHDVDLYNCKIAAHVILQIIKEKIDGPVDIRK